MTVIANEQSFQAIYLDPDAENWKERIIFHEPVFEDEMAAVITLKSSELENLIALVIAAPLNVLRHFHELVKESDDNHSWGKDDSATIIANLVKAAKDLGATIVYEQLGNEVPDVPPEQLPEGGDEKDAEQDEAHFFDPLTKKKIVEKGPHYFDPSLVTIDDVVQKMKRRTLEKAANRNKPKNPSMGAYPDDIADHGRTTWDLVLSSNGIDINKYKTPKGRWEYARYVYEVECDRIGVSAYKPLTENNPALIFKRLESSNKQVTETLSDILSAFKQRGLSRSSPTREIAFDVRQMGDNNLYLTTSKSLQLDGLANIQLVLKLLAEEFNFRLAKTTRKENGFKSINPHTKLTFSEGNRPNHINVYTTFLLPMKEACILCNTERINDIINALMKLLNGWVKTGKLNRL